MDIARQVAIVEFFWQPEMPKEEMPEQKKTAQQDRKVCLLLLKVIRVVGSGESNNLIIF